MTAAISFLSYMSNQPISACGASSSASSFDAKNLGSIQSGSRFSTSGRIRPERTVTVLVMIFLLLKCVPARPGERDEADEIDERDGAKRRGAPIGLVQKQE